jgi:hypothetical protein
MVTFGDFRSADPFDIKCPQKGAGRWADTKNWIYDFEKDLPAGVECEFSLKPDLKTLTGQGLTGVQTFVFSTGGPSIIKSIPREGQGIDEDQILSFTWMRTTDESVISNVVPIEDINERWRDSRRRGKRKLLRHSIVKSSLIYDACPVRHFAMMLRSLFGARCILRKRRQDNGRSDTTFRSKKPLQRGSCSARTRMQAVSRCSNDRGISAPSPGRGGKDRAKELHGVFSVIRTAA